MTLKNRILGGIAAAGLALSIPSGPPISNYRPLLTQAYAQTTKKYNPDTNPFEAGPAVKALAKKAEAGSPLETAKKLHSLLKKFKLKDENKSLNKDDRPPQTAEETAKRGIADCSDIAYTGIAAAKQEKIETGMVVLRVKGALRHVIQVVKINAKKYLLDPTRKFGQGAIRVGKTLMKFTSYDQAKKSGRIIMELDSEQAKALFHAEWGTYLKNIKGRRLEALNAFKKALEIYPNFTRAKNELLHLQEAYAVFLANKGVLLQNDGQYRKALKSYKEAKANYPASLGKTRKGAAMLKRLESYIDICRKKSEENN